jgi:hypothetical protein
VWKKRGVLADIKTGLRAWVRVQYEYLYAELLLIGERSGVGNNVFGVGRA